MRLERVDVLTCGGHVSAARGAIEKWTERSGLLLRLVTQDGRTAQGEASPLPGYSSDGIEATRRALGGIDWNAVSDLERGESATSYLARLGPALDGLPPAATFAVETALLDLAGQRRGMPIWALFDEAAPFPVPLSSLLGGADDEDTVAAAHAAAARGAHTVKVKIAGPRLGRQLGALARIREAIGDRPLRLDANRTFDAGGVRDEFDALRAISPELVEEPVPTAALFELGPLAVPIALDESLQDRAAFARLEPVLPRLGCVALVLKPMALGGFGACLELARRAGACGIDATVSHLFDGPVALAAAAQLALVVASRSRASGLDRHGGLLAWPTVALPFLTSTTIVATSLPGLGLLPLSVPR
jgi:o-succinylbenzoate synthase